MSDRRTSILAIAMIALGCSNERPTSELDGGIGHDAATRDARVIGVDAAPPPSLDGGLGPPDLPVLDPPSHGGTITFQQIGATGWYPSVRDPDVGPCDAYDTNGCCMARHEVTSDRLTPWNEDLVLTLRGPMNVAQLAVYQPSAAGWSLVSAWDRRTASSPRGLSFRGNDTESEGFDGAIGTECLVDLATDVPFPCGPGSEPFCNGEGRHHGWAGSKLFVLLARMPHVGDPEAGTPCSDGPGGNWYDAPWIGLSLGELARAGAFSSCQCYARNPAEWWLGDGCGQFNVFEVVNDNNEYRNLDVFSTNFFGYGGYVGEGPCGARCDVSRLGPEVDLIDKSTIAEAAAGAVASPERGPGAAFRRPAEGYRYFLVLLDETSRTVQLAIVHPSEIPAAAAPLLPALPAEIDDGVVRGLLDLRLPR
ncbi:DUF2403 domain-containing lipoprotein [Sandaracinus amylolyticus]|uniref:DUF2403 domain-containing lipoprotein n=1 Tax=Sandaracinus amylolyticus TaxID=927083 RepID=UPI001EEA8DAB|nr:DUF2403 domain-containing lipoprotein [Sandaracinus amylolyticus]UJR85495.1 Hypothetical protein I5071_75750 [Sandaracinus amylolyticus]